PAVQQTFQDVPQNQRADRADDERHSSAGDAPPMRTQEGPQPQQRFQIAPALVRGGAGSRIDRAGLGLARLASWIEHTKSPSGAPLAARALSDQFCRSGS